MPKDNELWNLNNLIITPHVTGGYHLDETLNRIVQISATNIKNYCEGKKNIGFRFEVQSHAKPLGITGYAKNNDDGSVTAQLQGSEKNINKVITDLQNIDRIQIDSVTEKEIPLDYYENDFYILY